MVLNYDQINNLCNNTPPLISDYEPKEGTPAKVDLRLGTRCYCSSQPDTIHCLTHGLSIKIPPNEVFLFQTLEKVNMPKHLVGHLSLKMGLVRKGLLMPSQTQIDPGYNNYLFGMFYNLSTDTIVLTYSERIVTVEFFSTTETSADYTGIMENITFEQFLSNRISCSLGNLHQSISALEDQTRQAVTELSQTTSRWNSFATAFSLVLAVLTIIVTIISGGNILGIRNNVAQLEEQLVIQEEQIRTLEEQLISQDILLDSYQKHLNIILQNQDTSSSDTFSPHP